MDSKRIADLLLRWYSNHFRALPWRVDVTPYHVWLSEIMLQQTRIEAVIPYYHRFVSTVPDIATLANLPEESLLKLWEGLGYYSRVRNLQKAAKIVMEKFGGELPSDYEQLLTLPGIGNYTAGAIASIAFSAAVPAVDGNVMRVLARLTNDSTDVLSSEGKKRFTELAWNLVPESHCGRFNQALMELGETICVPNGAPHCGECPLNAECLAYQNGTASMLPTRIKKTKRRIERRQVLFVRVSGSAPRVLLHRRPNEGLLAGMWELPNTTSENPLDAIDENLREPCLYIGDLPDSKHLFSHIEWRMSGYLYQMPHVEMLPCNYALATLEEVRHIYPLPSAFGAYTQLFDKLLCEEK